MLPPSRRARIFAVVLLAASATPVAAAERPPGPLHDRAFWRRIVEKEYAVPEGESAGALVRELSGYLGSPDPELRDEFGYGIPAAWIGEQQRLSPAELRDLVRQWTPNLRAGLGESGTDTVLLRSFSALSLTTVAAYDNEHPFLAAGEVRSLLDAALAYLTAEKDLRGYDPAKGWIHAVAHAADLVAALAASRHLGRAEHGRILDAVSARLGSAGAVFTWGEQERLAEVIAALVRRPDFQPASLDPWLARLAADSEKLWQEGARIDPAHFAAVQNGKDVLRYLFASLAKEETAGAAAARAKILKALQDSLTGL
jgi:Protein of unknown function (DUF2785)